MESDKRKEELLLTVWSVGEAEATEEDPGGTQPPGEEED